MNKTLKLSLIVVVALSFGLWGWSSAQTYELAQTPTVLVQGDYNYYEAVKPPQSIEEPALGAMSQDLASSDLLNVNGFNQYVLVGKIGYVNQRATTTVAFDNPFLIATTTAADKVVVQVNDAFGYTGATSTVSLVEITGRNATTTIELDCSASATRYVTSTPMLVNTEQRLSTSTPFMVRSGMASSTNPGAGSFIQDSAITGQMWPVTQILLTPQKPFLVCKVWQPYGTTLGTFTDSTGTGDLTVTAFISRQR